MRHTEGDPIDLAGQGIAYGQLSHANVLRFPDNLRTFFRQLRKRLQDDLFTFDKTDIMAEFDVEKAPGFVFGLFDKIPPPVHRAGL